MLDKLTRLHQLPLKTAAPAGGGKAGCRERVLVYTFHGLSANDFERLVRDLLRKAIGGHFQSFAAGRDRGIDLLQGQRLTGATVVQCKHYRKSGYSKLKSEIRDTELSKVIALNPSRYILATSVDLTPDNKEELLAILTPYCKGVDDIFGGDELNALLRDHRDVETDHYKLWLTSAAVLQRMLRNGMSVWNAMTKADIEHKLSVYVETKAYGAAMRSLKDNGACVISGIPGVGKTTLAEVLVAKLMEDGFELVAARDDIGEALEMLDESKRQVVYYDDFLGRSSLGERLGKNEDKGVLRLLHEARQSTRLKLVLTTREYILNDARNLHEPLSDPTLDLAKCIVKMEDYTRGDRARILYNHLYFSDLPSSYCAAVLEGKAYLRIINHPNYSPRLIEWMTTLKGIGERPPQAFVQAIVDALDNPLKIWEHVYDNQIDDDARGLLLCLASISGAWNLDDLQTAWAAALHNDSAWTATRDERKRFSGALKQLAGSLARTESDGKTIMVAFHNPSVRDYVARRIAHDLLLLNELLASSRFYEQTITLARLDAQGQLMHFLGGRVRDDVLYAALHRTIASPPCSREWIHFKHGGKFLGTTNRGLGPRLSSLARWCPPNDRLRFVDFLCSQAEECIKTVGLDKVAVAEACGFLDAVLECWAPIGGSWMGLVQRMTDAVAKCIHDSPSAPDWRTWSVFVRRHRGLFDDSTQAIWSARARTFALEEFDTIKQNADTASEAEGWLDEVDSVLSVWGITVDEERSLLEAWIKEHEGRDPDEEEWMGDARGNGLRDDNESSDAAIDGLFNSLLDRDGD